MKTRTRIQPEPKYRVERVRTDNGYGPGWVVLDHRGEAIREWHSWKLALASAHFRVILARANHS